MKSKIIFFTILIILAIGAIIAFSQFSERGIKNRENLENREGEERTTIVLEDDVFLMQLDEIYVNSKDYEGRGLKYEGFIYIHEETTLVVARNYYCCGTDSYLIGLDCEYEGEKPGENEWVEVEGIIRTKELNGDTVPYLEVTKLEVLEERGDENVYF